MQQVSPLTTSSGVTTSTIVQHLSTEMTPPSTSDSNKYVFGVIGNTVVYNSPAECLYAIFSQLSLEGKEQVKQWIDAILLQEKSSRHLSMLPMQTASKSPQTSSSSSITTASGDTREVTNEVVENIRIAIHKLEELALYKIADKRGRRTRSDNSAKAVIKAANTIINNITAANIDEVQKIIDHISTITKFLNEAIRLDNIRQAAGVAKQTEAEVAKAEHEASEAEKLAKKITDRIGDVKPAIGIQ